MTFGEKVRAARKAKMLDLRGLAAKVGVHFTYLSKVENGRLDFGDAPGEGLILKLAAALDADADELLLLAHKIPEPIRKRVLERPDAFRRLAELDDAALDRVLAGVPASASRRTKRRLNGRNESS
jgi:transcriptional regulator with XRE-family HTH domain